jgi:hypothetical protein
MKRIYGLLPLLLAGCLAIADAQAGPKPANTDAGAGSSSSINITDEQSVATLRGGSAVADIQGDRVELRDRAVYVNGVSFGAVPAICEVRYVVTKTRRNLFVDGKPRNPPATK